MELFAKLFDSLLVFVYHCFDRIVIHGYLSGLSRPEQVVYFFRDVCGHPKITKELLRQRSQDYQSWVEQFARKHQLPIWAPKGTQGGFGCFPTQRRLHSRPIRRLLHHQKHGAGPDFPNHCPSSPRRSQLSHPAQQRSLYTHYYFYVLDPVPGPMHRARAASFPSMPPTLTATISSNGN